MKQRAVILGLGKRCTGCWLKIMTGRDDIEITGLINRTPAREKEVKDMFTSLKEVPFFTSIADFLDSGTAADFCVVLTPPQVHYEQIKLLLSQKIDVLTEKPVVLSLEEGIELRDLSLKYGVHFWVGQNFRYSNVHQYMRKLILSSKYGKPGMALLNYIRDRNGYENWLNKYPLTMEQPMLFEQTEHHYDLFRYCYDTEIASVYGHTMNPAWSMYKNQATVANMFEAENGLFINYFGTWSSGCHEMDFMWRTDFDEGVTVQKSLFGDLYTGYRHDEKLMRVELKEEELFVTDTMILLNKFVDRHNFSEDKEIPTIEDNLKTIALMFATLESQKFGRRIYMDEFYKKYGV